MPTKHKKARAKKPNVKVRDLKTKKNPRGGRKAGKGQQEFSTTKIHF